MFLTEQTSVHMRVGTCDSGHEDVDGTCKTECADNEVRNPDNGNNCETCGGLNGLVCSDGTPPHLLRVYCHRDQQCAMHHTPGWVTSEDGDKENCMYISEH